MELSSQKPFEQPNAGMFLGTIIDVIDRPNVQTSYGIKNKVLIVWVLSQVNNQPALDSEGRPFRAVEHFNGSISPKSNLYKRLEQILNAAPPLITNSEQLSELLIGRSAQLFLVKNPNPQFPNDPTKAFTNVSGSVPLQAGQVAPTAPAGFVRAKDRPAQPQSQNTAPAPAYGAPAPQYAPAPVQPAVPTAPSAGYPVPPPQAPPTPAPQQTVRF